jgi:hypothetical protein
MSNLQDDLLLLWLDDNAERCRQRAREARAATQQPDGQYGHCVNALAEAHDAAAEVYSAAADVVRHGAPAGAPPPPCRTLNDRVELQLTNGCTIVSHGLTYASGADVHVHDAAGNEIGFWSWEEWAEDPEGVMGAILRCAAQGCSADNLAPDTLTSASFSGDGQPH